MKKIIKKFTNKIGAALIITSALAITPIQSAKAAEISDLINVVISVYNNMLAVYADAAYQFDPQIDIAMNNNQDILNTNIDSAMKNYVDLETSSAFAGIRAQSKKDTLAANIKAGDDVDLNTKDISLFGGVDELSKQIKDAESQKNNYMFNVEYLLGPSVYSDTTAKNNALAYLEQIKSVAPPPPVIRIGATFDVPVMNMNDPTQKTATVGQKTPLTSKDIDKLRKDLQSDPNYRSYKKTYRSIVALRNLFLDNLYYSYQIRLPQSNGKSIEQMKDEQAASRLTPDYYQQMSTASPDTVSRETLFVLAEISNELNEIRKQNERIIVMNSVNSLNQIAVTTQSLNAGASQIGQSVYCKAPGNEEDPLCTQQSSSSMKSLNTTSAPATTTTTP